MSELPTHKMVDGVRVELTEEEKAAILAEWQQWANTPNEERMIILQDLSNETNQTQPE